MVAKRFRTEMAVTYVPTDFLGRAGKGRRDRLWEFQPNLGTALTTHIRCNLGYGYLINYSNFSGRRVYQRSDHAVRHRQLLSSRASLLLLPFPHRRAAGRRAGGLAARRPRSSAPDPAAVHTAYTLTSGDVIRVQILGPDEPPPSQQHIDTLGNITMPLIGDVHVAGLTRDQAQQAIAQEYVKQRYYKEPQITINIDDYADREVSITGMVKAPGRFPPPDRDGLFRVVDLVTKAGGFTDIAKGSDVEESSAIPRAAESRS